MLDMMSGDKCEKACYIYNQTLHICIQRYKWFEQSSDWPKRHMHYDVTLTCCRIKRHLNCSDRQVFVIIVHVYMIQGFSVLRCKAGWIGCSNWCPLTSHLWKCSFSHVSQKMIVWWVFLFNRTSYSIICPVGPLK